MEINTRNDDVTLTPEPLYDKTASYTTSIPNSNDGTTDETDVYYPVLLESNTETLPIVLFLQGALIDKSDYSNYASHVCRYGFVVVIPNRKRLITEFNIEGLLVDTGLINDVLKSLKKTKQSNRNSPINSIIDTSKLLLLGHSWGGTIGLSAINDTCTPILCVGSFNRPDELLAAAFFGTSLPEIGDNNAPTNNFIPIENDGIPIAIIQGTLDGVTSPNSEQKSYDLIQTPPKAFITVYGTNHYGITNEDNLERHRNVPTLEQEIATETIARWSALFLRATVLDDRDAKEYVFNTGNDLDPNVTVISETK